MNIREQIKAARAARGLGDIFEQMAKPIAKALKLNCLDEQKLLKPDSPCARRRETLNKAVPFR